MSPTTPEDARERRDALLASLVETCSADERIVASFLGGSWARGTADTYSDIDVSVIVVDDAYPAVLAAKEGFVRTLGEPLFLEDFGNEDVAFVIFAGGEELELHFIRASDVRSIRPGPHRVLHDEGGILVEIEFSSPELDREAQVEELRRILSWFWHDVGHFTTAIGRGQLWWAGRAAGAAPPLLRGSRSDVTGRRGAEPTLLEARRRDLDGAARDVAFDVRSDRA